MPGIEKPVVLQTPLSVNTILDYRLKEALAPSGTSSCSCSCARSACPCAASGTAAKTCPTAAHHGAHRHGGPGCVLPCQEVDSVTSAELSHVFLASCPWAVCMWDCLTQNILDLSPSQHDSLCKHRSFISLSPSWLCSPSHQRAISCLPALNNLVQ